MEAILPSSSESSFLLIPENPFLCVGEISGIGWDMGWTAERGGIIKFPSSLLGKKCLLFAEVKIMIPSTPKVVKEEVKMKKKDFDRIFTPPNNMYFFNLNFIHI